MGITDARFAKSAAYNERASTVLPRSSSSAARADGWDLPIALARSKGSRVWDVDGNEYIDLVGGFGTAFLGHLPDGPVQAVRDQLERGVVFGANHPGELELAELICSMVPSAEMVTYCNSGTEAVQTALRIARTATGRERVLTFEGHYHGWLDPVTPLGNIGGSANARADQLTIAWNDLEALADVMTTTGGEIAAVIMEPIPCNNGAFMPAPGYLEAVRDWCSRAGAILIFDEVLTGFRVAPGGAQSIVGVTPDLTVLAKSIAAGFPLAAVCGSSEVFAPARNLGPLKLAGTYNGHGVGVAAAIATLTHIREHGHEMYPHMERTASQLAARIQGAASATELPLTVNRVGPILQLFYGMTEAPRDFEGCRQSDALPLREIAHGLRANGIYTIPRGIWFVSAEHTDEDADAVGDALLSTLSALDS